MKILKTGRVFALAALGMCTALVSPAQAASLELGLAIDGSGSISAADFNLQKQAYINVLSDLTVLPRDGTIAIGVKVFDDTVTTVFAMTEITNLNHASLIAALTAMTQPGGFTSIADAISAFTTEISGNGITSTRQLIDVSTDGANNRGDLAAAKANALLAGIDQINCIGVGGGADCTNVIAGTGSFSLNATNFNDFEASLRRKIIREVGGVPEPATWALMIAGFGLVGSAMRRRRTTMTVTYA
jgi:uncharacterized protein YegL